MAITTEKNRNPLAEPRHLGPPAPMAAVKIVAGAIVSVVSGTGYLTNGATATTHLVQGVAAKTIDNSAGAAGDKTMEFFEGVFECTNSAAADEITQADYGKAVFLVDNDVVAKTDGTGTRSIAGICRGLRNGKVLVEMSASISLALTNAAA